MIPFRYRMAGRRPVLPRAAVRLMGHVPLPDNHLRQRKTK